MSPLEKGARALALAQSGVDEWDALDEAFQENLKEHVRAVLKAIRDPSEGMTKAAQDARYMQGDAMGRAAVGIEWQAMIDASLDPSIGRE